MGIKAFLTGIMKGISNVLQNSVVMQKLLPILAVAIPPPWDVVAVIAVSVISAAMGVEEKPDELGWQMNEADKKPEDFSSFKEYKAYLDENYPFDQEKYDYLSDEQKTMCRYVGMVGTMQELKEAKGFELTPNALGMLVRCAAAFKWDDAQFKAFTNGLTTSLIGAGENSFSIVESFGKGSLAPDKQDAVSNAITAGAKEAGVKQDNAAIIASLHESV